MLVTAPPVGGLSAIWAEESLGTLSPTQDNGFQWSFGNGGVEADIVIPFDCVVRRLGFWAQTASDAAVELYVDRVATGATVSVNNGVTALADVNVAIAAGQSVTFRTISASGTAGAATVCASLQVGGLPGIAGPPGADGQGVPVGGAAGQVLVKTTGDDYDTEWADATGGSDPAQTVIIAEGLDLIAADAARAAIGDGGATTTFVQAGATQANAVSLADNNQFFLNDAFVGAFNRGGLYSWSPSTGDKLVSVKGHSGAYGLDTGSDRPVEMASAAFASRQFFWFSFRSAPHRHYVSALALASDYAVYGPNPNVNADGSSPDTPLLTGSLAAFETATFTTPTNGEYYLLATQPVVMTTTNSNTAQDQRSLPPLSTSGQLIGHTPGAGSGNGYISALYANTNVTIRARDGQVGVGVLSPGSPLSLTAAGFNASADQDYAPDGFLLITADGPIAGFVGADSSGTNATSFYPVEVCSQVLGIPIEISDINSGNAGIAVGSPYEGTARIYTPAGALQYTISLTRGASLNPGAATVADQLFPAAGRLNTSDAGFTSTIAAGSIIIADVPIYPVANFESNGTPSASSDETTLIGITPNRYRTQLREDSSGLLWRASIDASGALTYVRA
ncbi:MAG: hypothetical protein AAF360_11230 [Pseudomonadota bacterium]